MAERLCVGADGWGCSLARNDSDQVLNMTSTTFHQTHFPTSKSPWQQAVEKKNLKDLLLSRSHVPTAETFLHGVDGLYRSEAGLKGLPEVSADIRVIAGHFLHQPAYLVPVVFHLKGGIDSK